VLWFFFPVSSNSDCTCLKVLSVKAQQKSTKKRDFALKKEHRCGTHYYSSQSQLTCLNQHVEQSSLRSMLQTYYDKPHISKGTLQQHLAKKRMVRCAKDPSIRHPRKDFGPS